MDRQGFGNAAMPATDPKQCAHYGLFSLNLAYISQNALSNNEIEGFVLQSSHILDIDINKTEINY